MIFCSGNCDLLGWHGIALSTGLVFKVCIQSKRFVDSEMRMRDNLERDLQSRSYLWAVLIKLVFDSPVFLAIF